MRVKIVAIPAAAIAVTAGLLVAGCGGGGGAPPTATSAPATPQAQPKSTASQIQPRELVIRASEWKFEPAIIRAKAGQPLKVVFQNWGQEDHDLVFKGLQAQEGGKSENVSELPGWVKQQSTKEHMEEEGHHEGEMEDMHIDAEKGHMSFYMITPTKPGTYQLVCSYEGHTDQGQKATLIVEQ